jgi:hypothetical protein
MNTKQIGEENAAANLSRTTEDTRKKLESSPKTMFIIPLGSGEKPGAYEIVNINGYQLTIKKGEMVEIPIPVANILADHYRITMNAGQDKLVNRVETKDGIRVADALS